jgi:replicative DNA helicase
MGSLQVSQPGPHLEAERVVLGAILLDGRNLDGCVDTIDARHFAHPLHSRAFAALVAIAERGEECSLSALRAELSRERALETESLVYLSELLTGLPRLTDVSHWTREIREAARRRAAVALGARLAQDASEGGPLDEVLDRHSSALLRLTEASGARQTIGIKVALKEAQADLDKFAESTDGLTGCPTGIQALDRYTGGWQPGWLAIIAARPARGKSVFCNQSALAASRLGRPVLMFTLEMPPRAVARRMLLSDSSVDKWQLRANSQEIRSGAWAKVSASMGRLGGLPLWMDRRERPNLSQMRASAKRLHSTLDGGLGLIVVDYIQRCEVVESKDRNRYQALGELARGLKSMALSLGVPVLVAAQLSRAAQERTPTIADLRESGDIEQEADWVGLLHPCGQDPDKTMKADEPDVDMLCGKHRDGDQIDTPLVFVKRMGHFIERGASEWKP